MHCTPLRGGGWDPLFGGGGCLLYSLFRGGAHSSHFSGVGWGCRVDSSGVGWGCMAATFQGWGGDSW